MNDTDSLDSVAETRANFQSMLAGKILETDADLIHMAGNGAHSIRIVDAAYQRFHDLCGLSATLGLDTTSRRARTIDAILSVPFRARRGLTDIELVKLRDGLKFLQLTASNEMRSREFWATLLPTI